MWIQLIEFIAQSGHIQISLLNRKEKLYPQFYMNLGVMEHSVTI